MKTRKWGKLNGERTEREKPNSAVVVCELKSEWNHGVDIREPIDWVDWRAGQGRPNMAGAQPE